YPRPVYFQGVPFFVWTSLSSHLGTGCVFHVQPTIQVWFWLALVPVGERRHARQRIVLRPHAVFTPTGNSQPSPCSSIVRLGCEYESMRRRLWFDCEMRI